MADSDDSDEELVAALAASMENRDSSGSHDSSGGSSSHCHDLPHRKAGTQGAVHQREGVCHFCNLPEELQRRCLKHVSIANLITGMRPVSKHASAIAVSEVHERLRGLLFDALITGFQTELVGQEAKDPGSSSTPILVPPSASTSSSADSSAQPAPGNAEPSPMQPVLIAKRESLPPRLRLLALAEALEASLSSLAASTAESDRVRTVMSKARSLCFNLSDRSNPELRARVLAGELEPAALVRLSAQEMASGPLRAQRDEWHAKRIKRCVRPERVLGYQTSLYRCERCWSRTTRVHRTVRAGQCQVDRARTYVTCVQCNARWEEGGM